MIRDGPITVEMEIVYVRAGIVLALVDASAIAVLVTTTQDVQPPT
jgi:hypothetical protein